MDPDSCKVQDGDLLEEFCMRLCEWARRFSGRWLLSLEKATAKAFHRRTELFSERLARCEGICLSRRRHGTGRENWANK
jgi:hypothetical protein